jgi:hypothetical protein
MRSFGAVPDNRYRRAAASNRPAQKAPHRSVNAAVDGRIERSRACSCGGGCPRCKSAAPQLGEGTGPVAKSVQRQLGHIGGGLGSGLGLGTSTNYIFDTFQVTERNLSDPDIIARFERLSLTGLREYRAQVTDPAVVDYITRLIASRPRVPCNTLEVQRTTQLAEDGRTQSLPYLALARRALDRLHSRWIDNKADLLAGRLHLRGEVMCAFNSNFNITQSDPDYGVRQIWVMERLRHLETRMSTAAAYACDSESSDVCATQNSDTVAYVRDHRPPIHFCPHYRDGLDSIGQQATVIHEYAHLLPGVGDAGDYALGGWGAQVMTCSPNFKFTAASDILTNTADALAGFVMHIGQTGADTVEVR